VLFLFVVMLPERPHEDTEYDERVHPLAATRPDAWLARCSRWCSPASCGGRWHGRGNPACSPADRSPRSAAIGRLLFTEYAFAFEVTSILNSGAMIGEVVLARRDDPRERRESGPL